MNNAQQLRNDFPTQNRFATFYLQHCGSPNMYMTKTGDENVAARLREAFPVKYAGLKGCSVGNHRGELGLRQWKTNKKSRAKRPTMKYGGRYSQFLKANFPTAGSIEDYIAGHIHGSDRMTAHEKDIAVTAHLADSFPDMYGGMSAYTFRDYRHGIGASYVRCNRHAVLPEQAEETPEDNPSDIGAKLDAILSALLRLERIWE